MQNKTIGKKQGFEFVFSVQKQIYVECGGKLDFSYPSSETWEKFCDLTAWKRDGNWLEYPDQFFKNNFSPPQKSSQKADSLASPKKPKKVLEF